MGFLCVVGFASVSCSVPTAAAGIPADEARSDEPVKVLKLMVKVRGLRNDRGNVAVALFDSAKGFPDQSRAVAGKLGQPSKGQAVVSFEGLPDGVYAVAILHDENANGKMDFNFIGIPKEGYGFSNDASAPFGPPSFEAASFRLRVDVGQIVISANYLL